MAGKVVLDIGCGRRKLPGAIGVDRRVVSFASADAQRDVNAIWPLFFPRTFSASCSEL